MTKPRLTGKERRPKYEELKARLAALQDQNAKILRQLLIIPERRRELRRIESRLKKRLKENAEKQKKVLVAIVALHAPATRNS